jgi:GDP-4-dehydro-6-deoxy-D-mannose reductase
MHTIKLRSQQPQKALITGFSGFVGRHLADHLFSQGWQVFGFDRHGKKEQKHLYIDDLMNRDALTKVLKECRPDAIFHLAGLIKSAQPEALYKANLLGTIKLFESVLELGYQPVVIIASSGAVYGSGLGCRPITERFKPRPTTHYAVSKLTQEIAALRYFDTFQIPVIVARMFNLLGPDQSPDLACSAFARQIALAEKTGDGEIITGDLSTYRDFIDVRDAVRAFALLAEKGKSGQIYNMCSGRAVLMKKCLDLMLSMSSRQFKVRVDGNKIQKNDVPIQIGDARKLNQLTGWHSQISLKQSLSDLLEYWRQKVKSELEQT